MNDQTIRHLRGAQNLLSDAVEGGTKAIEEAHHEIARVPFGILSQIDPVAPSAQIVEQLQQTITQGVYRTIRAVNALSTIAAHAALDRLEHWASSRESQPPDR